MTLTIFRTIFTPGFGSGDHLIARQEADESTRLVNEGELCPRDSAFGSIIITKDGVGVEEGDLFWKENRMQVFEGGV